MDTTVAPLKSSGCKVVRSSPVSTRCDAGGRRGFAADEFDAQAALRVARDEQGSTVVFGYRKEILPAGQAGPHALPRPMGKDNWEDARMIPSGEAATLCGEWTELSADHPFSEKHKDRLSRILKGTPGSKATIQIKGRAVATFELIGPSSGRVRRLLQSSPQTLLPRIPRGEGPKLTFDTPKHPATNLLRRD